MSVADTGAGLGFTFFDSVTDWLGLDRGGTTFVAAFAGTGAAFSGARAGAGRALDLTDFSTILRAGADFLTAAAFTAGFFTIDFFTGAGLAATFFATSGRFVLNFDLLTGFDAFGLALALALATGFARAAGLAGFATARDFGLVFAISVLTL